MFVPAIDLTGEVELSLLKGEGEFIARVPIGHDPDSDLVYSTLVALSPLTGYADVPGYELIFQIVMAATDGSDVKVFWDGRDTRSFLVEPLLRQQVRAVLCLSVDALLDEAAPNLIHMTTHTPYLPDKALRKFGDICAILRNRGFIGGKADSWHGQHIWMMERLGGTS